MQEPWGEKIHRALEQMSGRRATGHHGPGTGLWGLKHWTGQSRGRTRVAPSEAPTPEMQEQSLVTGPDLGLCPLLVSIACHPSILSMSTVCHPPFGEAAAEDGVLCALAGDVVHPNPPCACGDRSTRLLSRDAGRSRRWGMVLPALDNYPWWPCRDLSDMGLPLLFPPHQKLMLISRLSFLGGE